jgi:hypothetical protein
MAQATEAQKQLLDEINALIAAWVDRGVVYKDVVPLFATYLVTTAIQGKYNLLTIMELIPRLWACTMLSIVEERAKEPLPPINPPSKL